MSSAAVKYEQALVEGDLAALSPEARVAYYRSVCESVGLNPLTRPFRYIRLNGALTLYATRDCTDQLRKRDRISVDIVKREIVDGILMVTARATTADGRVDEDIGAVAIERLAGEARANAAMKATTKAKRRVTLSICGLGMSDETEVDAIPRAQRVEVDQETGEILEAPAPEVPQPARAKALPPKAANETQPAKSDGAPAQIALAKQRNAELLAHGKDRTAQGLQKTWAKINDDLKRGLMTFEQAALLRDLKDQVKQVIAANAEAFRKSEIDQSVDPTDDFPESYNRPPSKPKLPDVAESDGQEPPADLELPG